MSTAAGIAAVTAVLKDLLINGLIDHDANDVLGEVIVTAKAPDRITLPEEKSQLNLFLYQITPNQGWRNVGLPSRDSRGDLINSQTLGLDLHYLLSAYGTKDFHSEILLGYAMKVLHETPVLSREAIRRALSPSLPVDGESLPHDLQDLFNSGLPDQIEQIRISPNFLSTEEMFKMWMAFQTPYRPTMAYHVSVVLIDSERKGKSALPVRKRNIYAMPFHQPVIEQVLSQSAANQPFTADQPILSNYRLELIGKDLQGEVTQVLIDGNALPENKVQVTDTKITFSLPSKLLAGAHGVQVVHMFNIGTPQALHRGVESNVFIFTLVPNLTSVSIDITNGAGAADTFPRSGTITVTVTPDIGKNQRVILLLNEFKPSSKRPVRAYRLEAESRNKPGAPDTLHTLTLPITNVLPATYLVRVQIDGSESRLIPDSTGTYATPKVKVL